MSARARPTFADAIARAAIHQLLRRARGATLTVDDPWGSVRFGIEAADAYPCSQSIHVNVTDPDTYARVLRHGSVGLGESYADGSWDTDDLTCLLRHFHRNVARTHPLRNQFHHLASRALDPISNLRRPNKERDARNIRAHYDLGDELFRQLLDPTMMYSCAYFSSLRDSLETASIAKMDRLAALLALGPGDRVLEIGTGWGGFATHAARTYGCQITTTTTSDRQFRFARGRVRAEGLEHLVSVRNEDYRDVRGRFDKVIAIEMIEAVDWREYDAFFAQCRSRMTDMGMLALQGIVVPDAAFDRTKRGSDFIKAAIFPGGCLPSIGALTNAAERGGLALLAYDDMGTHYAETLRRWRSNLVSGRDTLDQLGYDSRFRRLWEFYFSYCEAGFYEHYLDVEQMVFAISDATTNPPRVAPAAPLPVWAGASETDTRATPDTQAHL